MAELQEIELVVGEDGIVQIHVQGVVGQKCLTLTEDLEQILGNEITERIVTDEYCQQDQQNEKFVKLRKTSP